MLKKAVSVAKDERQLFPCIEKSALGSSGQGLVGVPVFTGGVFHCCLLIMSLVDGMVGWPEC